MREEEEEEVRKYRSEHRFGVLRKNGGTGKTGYCQGCFVYWVIFEKHSSEATNTTLHVHSTRHTVYLGAVVLANDHALVHHRARVDKQHAARLCVCMCARGHSVHVKVKQIRGAHNGVVRNTIFTFIFSREKRDLRNNY